MADADAAREQARTILSERRFQDPDVPGPFRTPLDWLGDRFEDLGSWLGDRFDGIDGVLPGGSWLVWVLLAVLVGFLGFVLARTVVLRRAAVAFGGRGRTLITEEEDPAELERAADASERGGEFGVAVRLRFRAGVLRLERARRLEPGGLRTTGAIGAALDSPPFDSLGADHDAIAYGGAPAGAPEATAARERWREVLT